jgi:hypothetical protein
MQGPGKKHGEAPRAAAQSSEFIDALRKGALVGLAVLVLVLPPIWVKKNRDTQRAAVATAPQVSAPAGTPHITPPPGGLAQVPYAPGVRLADFRDEEPSPDARLVANWVTHTADAKGRAFVVIDKKDARVYVFAPDGKLQESAPALLGSARGDDSFPGIGDKPLEAIRPHEKTTPAGRFVAEPGLNAGNEDVVWVSYDLAVSMHRIRPLEPRERRLERLASLTTDDNRISFGCINLPVTFYENVVARTVKRHGAVVYVLPEVRSVQEVFGAYDVTDPLQLAAAGQVAAAEALQRVAMEQASARPAAR